MDEQFFFAKNKPQGTPSWVRTVTVAGARLDEEPRHDRLRRSSRTCPAWSGAANLAGLELHVPQWHLPKRARKPRTDLLVFDLDPGAPAAIEECCEVAVLLRDLVAEDGLTLYAKTSGSKGMQVSAPISTDDPELTSTYAHAVARELEKAHPKLVVSQMTQGAAQRTRSSSTGRRTTRRRPRSRRTRCAPATSRPCRPR